MKTEKRRVLTNLMYFRLIPPTIPQTLLHRVSSFQPLFPNFVLRPYQSIIL